MIRKEDYFADPCGASSLPYWKTESIAVPDHIRIVKDASLLPLCEKDEPYFKLMHDLKTVKEPRLPAGYMIAQLSAAEFAHHICSCYTSESVTTEELLSYQTRSVYRPELWVAVKSTSSGSVVASGIAELDSRIGEGVLDWIQVSPDHRRRELGTFVVCELLKRMKGPASFATVSGRVNNENNPYALYTACGFANPVIWHVMTV